ncbi:hypothetical protein COEREDRAFT_11402 [Coemansia reversa NRRL 1564]|uniref:Uncharacterized protein n=1 Tax=Coemansia reversa (strain ATCC 12441 / NRRL 1564) TaxID=763665 RepID=A0A2G5B3B0_COERN|nr:hypothetical protein COEREDRAFT_11402 [Coemansia reversa NRRL 1564]|eukprot:PIA13486.1 hypothetical protein COEREDRAFT_11402 [Coemansia reversa NRRL 1564]
MNADQFSQFMASATVLLGQSQALKFSDFKGIVAPLIPQEQKANANGPVWTLHFGGMALVPRSACLSRILAT